MPVLASCSMLDMFFLVLVFVFINRYVHSLFTFHCQKLITSPQDISSFKSLTTPGTCLFMLPGANNEFSVGMCRPLEHNMVEEFYTTYWTWFFTSIHFWRQQRLLDSYATLQQQQQQLHDDEQQRTTNQRSIAAVATHLDGPLNRRETEEDNWQLSCIIEAGITIKLFMSLLKDFGGLT